VELTPYAGEPKLTLFSSGLLSKHGFSDGDAPDEYFDWLESQGREYYPFPWHAVLCELVERHVVPVLDQKVTTVRISTTHNPIRAETVNGADAERYWYGGHEAGEPALTPEFVEVPMSEVARIVAELA
jgi:hypothetical protein